MKTEGVDMALPIKSDPEVAPAKDETPKRETEVKKEDPVKGCISRYVVSTQYSWQPVFLARPEEQREIDLCECNVPDVKQLSDSPNWGDLFRKQYARARSAQCVTLLPVSAIDSI